MRKIYLNLLNILILFAIAFSSSLYAKESVSLKFEQINLPDAIRAMAKLLEINVIISPAVVGLASLHLQEANPLQAFDALLMAHGLAKWQMGNVWFIAAREEFIKQKQEEMKWQTLSDETLPLVMETRQLKFAHAEDILPLFKEANSFLLSKRGQVKVDTRTNSVIIYDIPERIKNIHHLLLKIDVPIQQILIEARLVSVDHDVERELGLQFAVTGQTSSEHDTIQVQGKTLGHYSLALAKLADSTLLDVKLAALENDGHAELISSPRLFTGDQQSASIEAGEELPYQEKSDSGGTTTTFKKAVLALKVKPQILPGNQVLLQLQINQDRPSNRMIQGVPSISTRQIMTNVLVKNGHTIVLGGIYESNESVAERRVPFIGKIPGLGWLFKEQTTQDNKRELLIFVTPKIIA